MDAYRVGLFHSRDGLDRRASGCPECPCFVVRMGYRDESPASVHQLGVRVSRDGRVGLDAAWASAQERRYGSITAPYQLARPVDGLDFCGADWCVPGVSVVALRSQLLPPGIP